MSSANTPGEAASPPASSGLMRALPWFIVVLAVVAILFLLFKQADTTGGVVGGIRKVDSAGLIAAQKAGAQVVDVRTAGEFALGHIPGAVNVPIDLVATKAPKWDHNGYYVLYCASGVRSAQGQLLLKNMGFKNVADLTGGIAAWTGQIEKGTATAQGTVPTSGKPVFIEFYTPT